MNCNNSRIIDKSCARYKIGLTGTLTRKDGRHVVFRDYFGDIVYKTLIPRNVRVSEAQVMESQS